MRRVRRRYTTEFALSGWLLSVGMRRWSLWVLIAALLSSFSSASSSSSSLPSLSPPFSRQIVLFLLPFISVSLCYLPFPLVSCSSLFVFFNLSLPLHCFYIYIYIPPFHFCLYLPFFSFSLFCFSFCASLLFLVTPSLSCDSSSLHLHLSHFLFVSLSLPHFLIIFPNLPSAL